MKCHGTSKSTGKPCQIYTLGLYCRYHNTNWSQSGGIIPNRPQASLSDPSSVVSRDPSSTTSLDPNLIKYLNQFSTYSFQQQHQMLSGLSKNDIDSLQYQYKKLVYNIKKGLYNYQHDQPLVFKNDRNMTAFI